MTLYASFTLEFMNGETVSLVDSDLERAPYRETSAIFLAFQNRSIGISPQLASELAHAIYSPAPTEEHIWHKLEKKLEMTAHALVPSVRLNVHPKHHDEIFKLRRLPLYSIFRIISPIIQRACVRLKRNILYCGNTLSDGIDIDTYNDYCQSLKIEVETLLELDNQIPPVFWKHHAFTLIGSAEAKQPDQRMYFTNLMDAGILIELNPLQVGAIDNANERLHLNEDMRTRQSKSTRIGVDGIKITRRDTDFHKMIFSEYLMPDQIRVDRMINSGYWAIKQPPKPVHTRDLLIMGLMPEPAQPIVDAFLKSVWLETLIRLKKLLSQSDLKKSEFRWIQQGYGNQYSEFATSVLRLDAIHSPQITNEKARLQTLMQAGWYPKIIEPGYQINTEIVNYSATDIDNPNQWLEHILKSLRDLPEWSDKASQNGLGLRERIRNKFEQKTNTVEKPIDFSQYKAIIMISFLPEGNAQTRYANWLSNLQTPNISTFYNYTVAYPQQVLVQGWKVGYHDNLTPIQVNIESPQAISRLLGELSDLLLTSIIKGLRVV